MKRRRDQPDLLEEPIAAILDRLAGGSLDSPAGTAAALDAALAAALVATSATAMEPAASDGAIAQANRLRLRLCQLAERTGPAYRRARDLLDDAEAAADPGAEEAGRDEALGAALIEAADVPLEVCEAAVDVVALAGWVARDGPPQARADAVAAACLAEAAAAAAATLVYVNLAVQDSDARADRARRGLDAARATRRELQQSG